MIRKYRYFKIIISLFIALNILNSIRFTNPIQKNSDKLINKYNNKVTQELSQCEKEWEQLNKDVFFRKNLAFYYLDLKEIRLYFERNKNKNYSYNVNVKIFLNSKIVSYDVPKINVLRLDGLAAYVTERINFKFDLNQFLDKEINNYKIKVIITSFNRDVINSKTNPIDLILKNFNVNDDLKKNSILCTKSFSFPNSYVKHFEWWIKMNEINGYDRISISNNSLGNGSIYHDLFKKYKDLIEVVQFQCIPNFFADDSIKKYVTFPEIKSLYNNDPHYIQLHFDYLNLNECYLTNKDKYKYVIVIDDDEVIIPRKLNKHALNESVYTMDSNKIFDDNNGSRAMSYIDYLNKEICSNQKSNLIFKMGYYLKSETVEIIFNRIGDFLQNLKEKIAYNYTIFVKSNEKCFGKELNFNITIKNEDEFKYVQYLYEMNQKYVKPYLINNKNIIDKVDEPFRRFYYFIGSKTVRSPWLAKSIHDTLQTNDLNTHWARHSVKKSKNVPFKYGHCSHFRAEYCTTNVMPELFIYGEFPVKDLYFDHAYFNDYFKVILKDF
jgi:hypothetical protein